MVEITNAVSQRANGKVFGCVGHEVPNHSFTWEKNSNRRKTEWDSFISLWLLCLLERGPSDERCGLKNKNGEILCFACFTCFVRIFCHPGNCNSSNFRITKAQEEGTVGFRHEHILSLLLVHKAQDGSKNRGRETLIKKINKKINKNCASFLSLLILNLLKLNKNPQQFPYPSFQCGFRCFFVSSITPSNHCQNVKFLPGKLSCKGA